MTKTLKALLAWTLVLCACSPIIPTTQTTSPASQPITTPIAPPAAGITIEPPPGNPNITGPKIIVTVGTPHIEPGPDGNLPDSQSTGQCAFSWATQSLAELTSVLEEAIHELKPEASARASAFGEDCLYGDGRKTFHAIETDFYIDLPVTDLKEYAAFGDWIYQTVAIVQSLPPDLIAGPRPGFVEYRFIRSSDDFIILRVPLENFAANTAGATGADLFLLFHIE